MNARCILLALLLVACQTVPTVTRDPVPPAEKLKAADCEPAVSRYATLLALSPREAEQSSQRQTEFRDLCKDKLAGQVRRVILRCWQDADRPAAFLACNDRF